MHLRDESEVSVDSFDRSDRLSGESRVSEDRLRSVKTYFTLAVISYPWLSQSSSFVFNAHC